MTASVAAGLSAVSPGAELRLILKDARTFVRTVVYLFTALEERTFLGVPVDQVLHFLLAAGLLLLLARFLAPWKAALLAVVPLLFKEAFDVKAKLRFLQGVQAPEVTMNSVWDLAAGVLGIGLGLLVVTALRGRWRVSSRPRGVPALHPADRVELPGPLVWLTHVGFIAVSVALIVGMEAGAVAIGRSPWTWVPHAVVIGATVAAVAWLGTANTLALGLAALPFLNWAHRHLATDQLNLGTTLILILFCCELVRRLRTARRRVLLHPADGPLLLYAVLAGTVVLVNCARLGWTTPPLHPEISPIGRLRLYWMIQPLTAVAVYLLAKNLLAEPALLRRGLVGLAAAFGVMCVIGIIEFVVLPLHLEVVPGAAFEAAPQFSVYLSLVWPFLLALALGWRGRSRTLFWAAVVLGPAAMALTYIRSGWAAVAGALLLVAVLFLWRRDWTLGLAGLLAAAVAVALPLWVVRHVAATPRVEFESGLVRNATSVLKRGEYGRARAGVVAAGNEILRRSPILGETGWSAHTLHQAQAVNYGVPVAALSLVAAVCILGAGWLAVWRTRSGLAFAVTAGATATLAAALLEGLGWSSLIRSSIQPLFWYILGLVPASAAAARARARPAAADRARRAPAARLVLLALALVCAVMIAALVWVLWF
jgi:hypothetical protein